MGWNNPPVPWRELERRLSGRPPGAQDAPVSRRKQRRPVPVPIRRPEQPVTPYAELHCHSHYSFLDGASGPADLVAEATRLGLHALALTDHDGFAGAPMFAEAARAVDLRTVYGAELSLGLTAPQNGVPDPEGTHLLVLARGVEGYHRLSAALTEAHLRGDEKGRPDHDLDELTERGRGHWVVLTGCRKGAVRQALRADGPRGAAAAVDDLVDRFGRDQVLVELIARDHPGEDEANDLLAALAVDRGLAVVATGNVHHASPDKARLAAAMAAIRARRSIAELDGWLDLSGSAHLRSGEEMDSRFARYPGAVAHTVTVADEIAFDLHKATPKLPKQQIPAGHTPSSWLRELTERGFAERYAGRDVEQRARERIERELAVIARKDFDGYFVIVHDIVAFARSQGILCQGRGSAASSAVCYALGITAVDAVQFNLPFERFISEHREEEPDIDVDFDSDRREEVIQWVYDTYGRRNAAQVANVVSYRPRMAVRDAAKALGFSPGQQDAWSKQMDGWGSTIEAPEGVEIPAQVVALADELLGAPRHLGIHSGGMVLTEQPIAEVCPIERARMPGRTILQWDKDGCEEMGLVKFDLLGLGMLGALDHMMRLIEQHTGKRWTLESIPKEEPAVYDMLCEADSIGVFQVESRAQIGTLPRLRPRCFYDLAIEIALIRPGPIQGGAVHPYVRRATGKEPVTYDHPSLQPVLERTLGVPIFQEQLMQMAVTLGDCTRDDADLLRRAMGSKRGVERIERIKDQLYKGMARRGITGDHADAIYVKILSFAGFGFAESHALSFALLVYASSWFKRHYPAAFLAGLLRNQPMGFYSPQSLVADARRHGVEVRRPDIALSGAQAGLEACAPREEREWFDRERYDAELAVRLGLDEVRGIGTEVAERIVAARADAPYVDIRDLSRRAGLTATQLEALATAGAFEGFGLDRRSALWMAGYAEEGGHLPASTPAPAPPTLPQMAETDLTLADLWATGISPERHPVEHWRERLTAAGIRAVGDLAGVDPGRRVHVAGLVTHRQRPGTAGGITFLNLEDETGMLNVVCSQGVMRVHRHAARNRVAVVIRGMLERQDGVTNLVADRISPLDEVLPGAGDALQIRQTSRDFR
ncbi:error-prone DNA polymerase [Nocardioides sp. GY 10113]|uniref:error-prone DNA polymerase n=1 Tax=Nocardioides sp. GY 10113 TaxID=2569761 RepID=UPI0010A82B86|nr:error-prone DNA polymerase [Nocardioides sp. GY 10113]TIC79610.1 error-prone DNA polymerase [Nocardioides sp. GY 10113]TIC79643.1 error-prone DNA polymerase [Nocardioides sp. GY 10113]